MSSGTGFGSKLATRALSLVRSNRHLKAVARITLAKTGLLSRTIQRVTDLAVAPQRTEIASRYIHGRGVEIGAMHLPLALPPGTEVTYVDRLSRAEAISRYPELDASRIVEPDVVGDGFVLAEIGDGSQDFVIANHVLEHSANPLQTVANWNRVLRPGGILFVTVPVAEMCFDRGRPETPVAHIIEDYQLCSAARLDEFDARTFAHYVEWVTITMPNAARDEGKDVPAPSSDDAARLARELADAHEEIHFHTFSAASFENLLSVTARTTGAEVRIEEVADLGGEVVGVLRRAAA